MNIRQIETLELNAYINGTFPYSTMLRILRRDAKYLSSGIVTFLYKSLSLLFGLQIVFRDRCPLTERKPDNTVKPSKKDDAIVEGQADCLSIIYI